MSTEQKKDLIDLFNCFDGDRKEEFIEKHPAIWDDCYDIMEQSRYHRVMLKCVEAGYDQGFSDAKESLSEGVHTCHDQCQRVACVQRRKIEELEGKLKIATDAMQEADLWRIDKCLASNLDSDFNVLRDILYLALIKIKYDEKVII